MKIFNSVILARMVAFVKGVSAATGFYYRNSDKELLTKILTKGKIHTFMICYSML